MIKKSKDFMKIYNQGRVFERKRLWLKFKVFTKEIEINKTHINQSGISGKPIFLSIKLSVWREAINEFKKRFLGGAK